MPSWILPAIAVSIVPLCLFGVAWLVRQYRRTAQEKSRLEAEIKGLKADDKIVSEQVDILLGRDGRNAIDRMRTGKF